MNREMRQAGERDKAGAKESEAGRREGRGRHK